MNGQLREHPLAELIREIVATNLSGALRLERERIKAVVYASQGRVILARTNLRLHRLVECIRRWDIMRPEQFDVLLTESMSDAEARSELLKTGALTTRDLEDLRARQTADVLRASLLWIDGEWSFDPRAQLVEEEPVELNMKQLLLDGARRLPVEFTSARLAQDEELISPSNLAPDQIMLLPVEGFILSRIDAPLRLHELGQISGMPDEQTRHVVYTLALGGLLLRSSWPQVFTQEALAQAASVPAVVAAATQTRTETKASANSGTSEAVSQTSSDSAPDLNAEVDALLARLCAGNFYDLLGVERDAQSSEIKRAYYALAKRFHPDRFQRDVNGAVYSRVESAFARIAQAYETLKDDKARLNYDKKLAMQQPASPSPSRASKRTEATARNVAPDNRPSREAQKSDDHIKKPLVDSPQYRAEEKFQQGLAALEQNYRPRALTCFAEAVRLAPQHPRYHAHYGQALMKDVSTRRQAEAELRAAISLDAGNTSYCVLLAELYQMLGQHHRAEVELEQALKLDPQHADARRMLARMKGVTSEQ